MGMGLCAHMTRFLLAPMCDGFEKLVQSYPCVFLRVCAYFPHGSKCVCVCVECVRPYVCVSVC